MRELTRAYYSGEVPTVDVLPGLASLWIVLRIGDRQWRVGFGGKEGVDMVALARIARAYSIPDDARFYELVKVYEEEALKVIREKLNEGKDNKGPCTEAEKRMCMEQFGEHFEWACRNCEKNKVKESDA